MHVVCSPFLFCMCTGYICMRVNKRKLSAEKARKMGKEAIYSEK